MRQALAGVLLAALVLPAACAPSGSDGSGAPGASRASGSAGASRSPGGPVSVPELPDDLERTAPRAEAGAGPDLADLADLAELAEQEAGRLGRPLGDLLEGGDVSWPQCPRGAGIPERRTLGLPMPLPTARFVVLGLTNGPAFFPNPCLAEQVAWVRERGLLAGAYAVATFPDDRTRAAYAEEGPFDGSREHDDLRNVGY